MKLCECGCGLPAPIAPKTVTLRGWVKGEPIRFRTGHNGRTRPFGTHYPLLSRRGLRISVHRDRAERALGKPLPSGAEVHHADGTRLADAPLVICQSHAHHKLLHVRTRIVRAGGNPNTDAICGRCGRVRPRSAFQRCDRSALGVQAKCRECQNACSRERRERTAA